MDVQSTSTQPVALTIGKAMAACVVIAGTIAGTLDISDALIFYGLRGTPARLLLQVIASGLVGAAALKGEMPAALLGLSIHYFIAWAWATIFILASLRIRALRRFAVLCGSLYGLLIYAVMNYVVLPHTRVVGHPTFRFAVLVNGVAALVFCMGLPIALITRRFFPID